MRDEVRQLNEHWEAFYDAEGPVNVAAALLQFANAWSAFAGSVLEDEPAPEPRILVPADLHMEGGDGHGFALLETDRFFAGVVFPGATVSVPAGRTAFRWSRSFGRSPSRRPTVSGRSW